MGTGEQAGVRLVSLNDLRWLQGIGAALRCSVCDPAVIGQVDSGLEGGGLIRQVIRSVSSGLVGDHFQGTLIVYISGN